MQVHSNSVVIQLSSAPSAGGAGAPVFSVSRTTAEGVEGAGVQISAAARALAEVSGLAARPQLNMFVQYVGALGGNGRSFVPVSPTATAQARVATDTGEDERAAAAERAIAEDSGEGEAQPQANTVAATVEPAAPAPAPVSTYQQVAASAAPAPAATVDVSV